MLFKTVKNNIYLSIDIDFVCLKIFLANKLSLYRYICANLSLIVTKIGQPYPWPWDEVITFWKVKVKG